MDLDAGLLSASVGATVADAPLHVLSGSFRSLSLALLAFYPANRTLEHVRTVDAFGPHQYLALNAQKGVVYTTSWATPPILSSWSVKKDDDGIVRGVEHLNTVQITATSSYIDVPPPFDFVYSVGGPTGEVHRLEKDGSIGEKVQEFLFVPPEELEKADKSRVALRHGSHGIEFSSTGYAFIPVLGTSTIEMYRRDQTTGGLEHIFSSPSPRGPSSHDGPRHVKVHPNGKVLYCVTEHNNLLDVYQIENDALIHYSEHSLLPTHLRASGDVDPSDDPHLRSEYRGGTLMLTPSTDAFPAPIALFTTTRGATPAQRGWVSVFKLGGNGLVVPMEPPTADSQGTLADQPDGGQVPLGNGDDAVRFGTPTSSGKANALDIRAKSRLSSAPGESPGFWIVLTDDDRKADLKGAVRVLEWNGWGVAGQDVGMKPWDVNIVAEWPDKLGRGGRGRVMGEIMEVENAEPEFTGASHAIWLD